MISIQFITSLHCVCSSRMAQDSLEFSLTQKGKRKACYRGYFYNFDKTSKENTNLTFWICENYSKKQFKCKGRLHIKDEVVVKIQGEHNHAPNESKKQVFDLRAKIRDVASTSNEPTVALLANVTQEYPSSVVAQLASKNVLKRTVQQVRKKARNIPPEPRSLEELTIPECYQNLNDGTQFLLHDSGPGNERFLLFGTRGNLNLLTESTSVFSDGTFSAAPSRFFYQLYTIHASVDNHVIPLVYALLPNKRFETYNRLFSTLVSLQPQFKPEAWLTDFELAAIQAIMLNFPQAAMTGCFFHMQQCLWRKIQNLGLSNAYKEEDEKFAMSAKSLACLAFVPLDDVTTAFDELINSQDFDIRMQPVVDYFEEVWIGRQSASGFRQEPMFAISLWNVYERTKNHAGRTNNSVEGWHRRFNSLLQCSRPSIFKCIDVMRVEQKWNEDTIARISAGEVRPPQKKIYRDVNKRIFDIVSGYD